MLIFNNFSTEDIFAYIQLWKSEGKYTAIDLPYGEYKRRQGVYLDKNRKIIENEDGSATPSKLAAKHAGAFQTSAMENVKDSYKAWQKLNSLMTSRNNNGVIYGWDTETFGDITGVGDATKGSGVSELGIARNVIENGKVVKTDSYSILINMNKEQSEYVDAIIKKIENGTVKDWNDLSDAEQVTLNRVSMYRTAKETEDVIDFMGNTKVKLVSGLSAPMGKDMDAVKSGLAFMTTHGSNIEDVLPEYTKLLLSGRHNNTVLVGANTSQFDVKVLKTLGVSESNINTINKYTVDTTMGHRLIALTENISEYLLNEKVRGTSLLRHLKDSGTVSAANEALGYQEFSAHEAGVDALISIRNAISQKFFNGMSFVQKALNSYSDSAKQLRQIKDKDKIIFVNHGYLDKNSLDQVRIGSETTQSYTIYGNYWTFDEEKSGMRMFTPEGETEAREVYVASFKSAVPGEEDVEFSKAFESEEKFLHWRMNNTTVYDADKIGPEQIASQSRRFNMDLARRDYEGFFDVGYIGRAGKNKPGKNNDERGFASLEKNLKIYNEVDKYLNKKGITTDNLFNLDKTQLNEIKDILSKKGLKYSTQQRSFMGMYGKLKDEHKVLEYIVDYVNNSQKGVNNVTKTMMAHDMRETFLTQMNPEYTTYDNYSLSDVFSIDILGGDGNYHTIEGQTKDKLISSLYWFFKKPSTQNDYASLRHMMTSVDDLYNRGVLGKNEYKQLSNILNGNPSLYNASVDIANALDGIFQPFRVHSGNPITMYKQIMQSANTEAATSALKPIHNKNIDGIPPSVKLQRMRGTRVKLNDKVVTASEFFENNPLLKKQMNAAGDNAVGPMKFVENISFDFNDSVTKDLQSKLNYSTAQIKKLDGLFNAWTRDEKGNLVPAKHSINGRRREGLVSGLLIPNEPGNSGYVILTNERHSSRTVELLSNAAKKDLTYDELNELIGDHASILELKAFNSIPVGDMPEGVRGLVGGEDLAYARFVIQGTDSAKYLNHSFNLYVSEQVVNGEPAKAIVRGGIIEPGTEIIQSYYRTTGNAIDRVLQSEFGEGSRIIRSGISKSVSKDAGSASEQGMLDEVGERIRSRNFNQSDVNAAFRFELSSDALQTIQKQILESTKDLNLEEQLENNPLAALMYIYNFDSKRSQPVVSSNKFIHDPMGAYETIMNSPGWKEFYVRHAIAESVGKNRKVSSFRSQHMNFYKQGHNNKTFFDILIDTATEGVAKERFSEETKQALKALQQAAPHLSQNRSETDVNNLVFSLANPGSFNVAAPGISTNRPMAQQGANTRNMKPSSLPTEYLDRVGAVPDSLTTSPRDKRWNELDTLMLPDGTPHKDQISSITATVKQLSDTELLKGFNRLEENIESIAKENGLDADLLRKALNIQMGVANSIFEDSMITTSSIATAFYESSLDTKKLKFNRIASIKDEDSLNHTKEKLNSLKGKVVKKGDVIGYDSSGLIFWEGQETVLTNKNVEDIFKYGETVITPTNTISSRKINIGKAEKGVASGVIVDDEFLKTHSYFSSKEQAHKYLDFIIEEVAGTSRDNNFGYIPSFLVNTKVAKHVSGGHLRSKLYLIVNEHRKAGTLDALVNTMRQNGYDNWSPEVYNGTYIDKLFADTEYTHFTFDIIRMLEDIKTNTIGDPATNKRILDVLKYFDDNSLMFDDVQNNIQTQIMGEKFRMDPRTEAVIRRRNMGEFYTSLEGGINGVRNGVNGINGKRYEDIFMDEMYRTVTSGQDDYIHASDLGDARDEFNRVVERFSKQQNTGLIKRRRRSKEQEQVVAGIYEASKYLFDPSSVDLNSKNIIHVSMDELIQNIPVPTTENLANSIFRNNGKLSKFITDKAGADVDLNAKSLTIALDLGRNYRLVDTDYKGNITHDVTVPELLVPIYNIYGNFKEEAIDAGNAEAPLFASSLGDFMNFFNVFKDNVHKLDDESVKAVTNSIIRYRNTLTGELATDDKTSLLVKTFGQYELPNSAYMLGQDSVSPVVSEMFGLSDNIYEIKKRIQNEGPTKELLKELSNAYLERDGRLKSIVEDIKSSGSLELYGNKITGHEGFTKAANGGFLSITAVNRKTFEQHLGFDIGLFGKSIFDDLEKHPNGNYDHYMSMGTRTFDLDVNKARAQIVNNLEENINSLDFDDFLIEDFIFDNSKSLKENISDYMITVRDLNEEIRNNKSTRHIYNERLYQIQKAIAQSYDFVGVKFLSEIGLTTRLTTRNPAFGVGIGPTNIILDDNIGDDQARQMTPTSSKTLNLDHDGDTLGIAIHNAANAMNKRGANAKEIDAALHIIERNALDDFNILTKMIEDGDAFKSDDISDIWHIEALAFKTYDKEGYKKAYNAFLSNNGIKEEDYVDEALEFFASHSSEMRKAVSEYTMTHGNYLQSAEAIIAALKVRTNKENIGLISNASFSFHDAVVTAFEQTTDENQKKRIAKLHQSLDYISDKGMDGLLTVAEQKGIDVKHIYKATEITDIDLFKTGINALMDTNNDTRNKKVETALVNILQSLDGALFDRGNKEELIQIAQEILATNVEEYDKKLEETIEMYAKAAASYKSYLDKKDYERATVYKNTMDSAQGLFEDLTQRRQVRAMFELTDIQSVRVAFNSPMRKGFKIKKGEQSIGVYKGYVKFMQQLNDVQEYDSGVNVINKARKKVFEASSDIKLDLNQNTVYVTNGDLNSPSKGYIIAPENLKKGKILGKNKKGELTLTLRQVNLNNGSVIPSKNKKGQKIKNQLTITGNTVAEIMDKASNILAKNKDGKFISIEQTTLKEHVNMEAIGSFDTDIHKARAYNILNDLFIDGNEYNIMRFNETMGAGVIKGPRARKVPADIRRIRNGVGQDYFDLIYKASEYDQMDEIKKLYDYMAASDTRVKDMGYEGFIKAVNANIVNNPEQYANHTDFRYIIAIQDTLREIMGESAFNKYIKNFNDNIITNTKIFNNALDILRKNVYDITGERKVLEEGFDSLRQYLDFDIVDINDAYFSKKETIKNIINPLAEKQTKIIHDAETAIYDTYSLFSSKENANRFFGWDAPGRQSKVGFGEFMGFKFEELSQDNINSILRYAKENEAYYTGQDVNPILSHAYQQTVELLDSWTRNNASTVQESAIKYSTSESTSSQLEKLTELRILGEFNKTMDAGFNPKEKKKLSDVFTAEQAKAVWDKLPKKGIGIAAASMAAIGITNNILHKQKQKSPLAPRRQAGGNKGPDYTSPAEKEAQVKAPTSQTKTIYHDNGSGFTFKVSASTRKHLDAQNNAKLIGMSGGGNSSVYSQSDTSRVTDNWLANKFAELA